MGQDIFQLFINQLQGLEKPSSSLFKLYYHLLQTLAAVKAFVLMIEDQEIMVDLFKTCFSLVGYVAVETAKHDLLYISGFETDNIAIPHLSDIIVSLFAEMNGEVDASLLDEICKHLVSPNKV